MNKTGSQDKKIFFASDFHLGTPDHATSLIREKKIVQWLHDIEDEAKDIYLMGDIFDFWFEYKQVVPRGYSRLIGKLALLSDKGIKLHIFTGNHDLWMRDFFKTEMHAEVYKNPITRKIDGKIFYLAHGDGLGPGDKGFKMLKKLFTNPAAQWSFRQLHPDVAIRLAGFFSKTSRKHTADADKKFLGEDKEWLILHSKEVLKQHHIDYFIYGHRHYPLVLDLQSKEGSSKYVNLGDWIDYCSYAVWNGKELELKYYGK